MHTRFASSVLLALASLLLAGESFAQGSAIKVAVTDQLASGYENLLSALVATPLVVGPSTYRFEIVRYSRTERSLAQVLQQTADIGLSSVDEQLKPDGLTPPPPLARALQVVSTPFLFSTRNQLLRFQSSDAGRELLGAASTSATTLIGWTNKEVRFIIGAGSFPGVSGFTPETLMLESTPLYVMLGRDSTASATKRRKPADLRPTAQSPYKYTDVSLPEIATTNFAPQSFIVRQAAYIEAGVIAIDTAKWNSFTFEFRDAIAELLMRISADATPRFVADDDELQAFLREKSIAVTSVDRQEARATQSRAIADYTREDGPTRNVAQIARDAAEAYQESGDARRPFEHGPRPVVPTEVVYLTTRAHSSLREALGFGDGRSDLSCGTARLYEPWLTGQTERIDQSIVIPHGSHEDCRRLLIFEAETHSQVVVFVHGYANSHADALRRAGQLQLQLASRGYRVILLSWPSRGRIRSYDYDVESAEESRAFIRNVLSIVLRSNARSFKVIGHSLGGRLIAQALSDMGTEWDPGNLPNVFLAAPDIPTDVLLRIRSALVKNTNHVTLYANQGDLALAISQAKNGSPRAGTEASRFATNSTKLDAIDVVGVPASYSHDYVFTVTRPRDDLIGATLTGAHAGQRELQKRYSPAGTFWQLHANSH